MPKATVILIGLGFAAGALARSQRGKRGWFRHLKGWQKALGLIAVLMAVVVILNPEFLALGLLGDSAFFDVLALALSVQMIGSVQWVWHHLRTGFAKCIRWLGIPSPGFSFLMCISTVAIANAISALQKVTHRLWS